MDSVKTNSPRDWKGLCGAAQLGWASVHFHSASGISFFCDTFSVLQSAAWVASGPLGTVVTCVLVGTEVPLNCWYIPRLAKSAQYNPRGLLRTSPSWVSLAPRTVPVPAPRSLLCQRCPASFPAPFSLRFPVLSCKSHILVLSKFHFPLHFLCFL